MAEEPYDDLDIGYVEWPMPTTEELTVVRFLDKQGVFNLWTRIGDKFLRIPKDAEEHQILTYRNNGVVWADAPSGIPSDGVVGQVLTKTESGYGWQDSSLPDVDELRPIILDTIDTEELLAALGL